MRICNAHNSQHPDRVVDSFEIAQCLVDQGRVVLNMPDAASQQQVCSLPETHHGRTAVDEVLETYGGIEPLLRKSVVLDWQKVSRAGDQRMAERAAIPSYLSGTSDRSEEESLSPGEERNAVMRMLRIMHGIPDETEIPPLEKAEWEYVRSLLLGSSAVDLHHFNSAGLQKYANLPRRLDGKSYLSDTSLKVIQGYLPERDGDMVERIMRDFDGLADDEKEKKLRSLLIKFARYGHYFESVAPLQSAEQAKARQQEVFTILSEIKGFFEDPNNDWHNLSLIFHEVLVARQMLVEWMFYEMREQPAKKIEPEKPFFGDWEPDLGFDYFATLYPNDGPMRRENLNKAGSPQTAEDADPPFDLLDHLNESGAEATIEKLRRMVQEKSLTRATLNGLRFVPQEWYEAIGLTDEERARIDAEGRPFYLPPEGIGQAQWGNDIRDIALIIRASIGKNDWAGFITEKERADLEQFGYDTLEQRKEEDALERETVRIERQRKEKQREEDPGATIQYAFGVVRRALEDCGDDIAAAANKLRTNRNLIRLLAKHRITGATVAKRELDEIKADGKERWPKRHDLRWQTVAVVISELTSGSENVAAVPKFIKSTGAASALAIDLLRYDRAELRDDLPAGVADSTTDDHLRNYENKEMKFADQSSSRWSEFAFDYGDDKDEGAQRRIAEHVLRMRRLYQSTQAVPAWWMAPERKRVSLLKETVWQRIKSSGLKKEAVLTGFDELLAQCDSQISRIGVLLVANPSNQAALMQKQVVTAERSKIERLRGEWEKYFVWTRQQREESEISNTSRNGRGEKRFFGDGSKKSFWAALASILGDDRSNPGDFFEDDTPRF